MITAIDTNILLDILDGESNFYEQSAHLLKVHGELGSLVISPIVYSELLVSFLHKHEPQLANSKLNEFLNALTIEIMHFEKTDYALAAEAWLKFSLKSEIICQQCGAVNTFTCKKCKSTVKWRNHMITYFLIGAHAQNHAEVLLTRDKGYYRKYFRIKVLP